MFGSLDASRKTKVDLIEAHAHYKYSESRGLVTARNGNARLQYSYTIWRPWYVYVRGSFDYDRSANLNLRTRGGKPGRSLCGLQNLFRRNRYVAKLRWLGKALG